MEFFLIPFPRIAIPSLRISFGKRLELVNFTETRKRRIVWRSFFGPGAMIDFNSLRPVYASLAREIQEGIQRVLDRGWYVLGPEVEAFEAAFARYPGVDHAVAVARGTDASEFGL